MSDNPTSSWNRSCRNAATRYHAQCRPAPSRDRPQGEGMMRRLMLTVAAVAYLSGTALFAQDAKKIADGKKVYDAKECAKCHMIAGKGNKIGPLDGVGTKLTEADIRKWFTDTAAMEAKL